MSNPLVLTRNDWYPPEGMSALPVDVQKKVPAEMKYWNEPDEEKREEMLDVLRDAWDGNGFEPRPTNILSISKSHSRSECMECNNPPEFEVLWAEGMARAWFCKEHFEQWVRASVKNCIKEGYGPNCEIDAVKVVDDGEVGKKWGDNKNTDIWSKLIGEFTKKSDGSNAGETRMRIAKSDYEKQWVFSVALTPHEIDSWGDIETPGEIEEAIAKYMFHIWNSEKPEVIGSEHEKPIDAIPVQCFQAPCDFWFKGTPHTPEYMVAESAWVLAIHILDKSEFEKVVSGEYTGLSMQGTGMRRRAG